MNEIAEISFDLQSESAVKVNIYSISGIIIRSLYDKTCMPGRNLLTWDGSTDGGSEAGPGIYICKVEASAFTGIARIVKF